MKQLILKSNLILAAIMLSLMFVACGKDDDDVKSVDTIESLFPFLKLGHQFAL